ncbi:tRNA (adenosine(37)-N6)-threonylcarbamoyltransferase complex ATPase subunit type 1 TsaE [Corynebacterium sp. 335C]
MNASFPTSGTRVLPDADDMRDFGEELGASLRAGDLVILDGPLGAGKTTLTQGIARGLGVRGRVTSPTFTIAREHRPLAAGGARLVHADLYRLLDMGGDLLANLDSLDLDTDLGDCVVVAEWGGGVAEQLADRHLLVSIDRTADDESRTVTWRWSDE